MQKIIGKRYAHKLHRLEIVQIMEHMEQHGLETVDVGLEISHNSGYLNIYPKKQGYALCHEELKKVLNIIDSHGINITSAVITTYVNTGNLKITLIDTTVGHLILK